MKKFLSMILAVLLVFSVMAPITAFAENGPHPFDPESEDTTASEMSEIVFMYMGEDEDVDVLDSIGVLYPQIDGYTPPKMFKGASYDLETNTLTLEKVVSKDSMLVLVAMGDDFKINLIGYNELACIISSAGTRGGSVTIIGDGELVLNRNKNFGGIMIDANESISKLTIEETVKFKAYASPESKAPSINILSSNSPEFNELIQLGGTVVSDEPEIEKYTKNIYEQIEAYDLEWNYYDWYEFGLKKDGVYYIADVEYDEETFEDTGYYLVYAVSYDEILDCYTLGECVKVTSLSEFEVVTEFEPMLDESLGYYIGYTDYPDEEDDSYKTIFFPEEKEPFDICVDENGTKYGFWQYSYEEEEENGNTESGVDTYVYNLIDHPTYGIIAVEDETKETLDGLTPLKIGEKALADCYIYSDVTINNGGSIIEPAKIKNITATNTNQGVKVSWAADPVADNYRIYRKVDGGKKWKTLDTISASKTSFVDKTAKGGTKYIYTVKGYNFVGWGKSNSTGVTHTFYDAPYVTIKTVSSGVYLNWAKISGATKYRIYRQTSGSSKWTLIDTVKGTSFTDKTAKSGTKYYYRVRAAKGDVMSGYNVVSKYFLSAPKLSSVKNVSSGIAVSWSKVSGAEGYKVYRKSGSGSFEYLGKTTKTTYTDKTVKSGKTYTYTVRAYKSSTNSAYNKTGLKLKHLAAPKTETKIFTSSISVSWSKVSGAKEYAVYRKADGESKWTKLTTTDKLSYKDTAVKNNKTYSYRVKAINGKTISGYKTTKQSFLATPKLSSIKNTNTGVEFKWSKVSGATGYKIYRKSGSGDFKLIAKTKKATYTDDTVNTGALYTYTVRAYNDNATSYYNKTGLKIRYVDSRALYTPENERDGILLRFEPAEKADKYYIYREVDGTDKKEQIAVLNPEDLEKDQYGVYMYIDKTAENGETYAHYIRVYYKGSFSAYMRSSGKYITRMESVDVTSATATSDGIRVKWEKNPYATSYSLFRKEKGTDEYFKLYSSTDNGKTLSALDKDVESGKTYLYAVRANYEETNKNGWAALGESKSAKAK